MGESSEEEVYEVLAIVGHKDFKKRGRKYEVKWKGYEETTFEPLQNLIPNSTKLVQRYNKKHPLNINTKKSKRGKKVSSRESMQHKKIPKSGDEETDSDYSSPNYRKIPKKTENKSFRLKKIRLPKKKSKQKKSSKRLKARSQNRRKAKKAVKRRASHTTKKSNTVEYEVELLLNHRDTSNGREFLVKWKGYPKSESTWEPSCNIWCKSLVRQYEHIRGKWKNPSKRKRIAPHKADSSKSMHHDSHDERDEANKKPARLIRGADGKWRKESVSAGTSGNLTEKKEEGLREEDEKQREPTRMHTKAKKKRKNGDKIDDKQNRLREDGKVNLEDGITKTKRKKSPAGVDKVDGSSSL